MDNIFESVKFIGIGEASFSNHSRMSKEEVVRVKQNLEKANNDKKINKFNDSIKCIKAINKSKKDEIIKLFNHDIEWVESNPLNNPSTTIYSMIDKNGEDILYYYYNDKDEASYHINSNELQNNRKLQEYAIAYIELQLKIKILISNNYLK